MAKKLTIKDIAEKAGMSLATISGVLNGETRFSEKTRASVWKLANELNYMPNAKARSLRNGSSEERQRTNIIMHIVHMSDVVPNHARAQEADVYRLSWYARQRGLYVIPYCYFHKSGFQCPPLLNGLVDGAIIGTPHPDVVNTVKSKVPVVLMDVPFSMDLVDVPMANIDHKYGFLAALAELKKLGHRRIASLHSPPDEKASVNFEKVIMHNLAEAAAMTGIEIVGKYDFSGPVTPQTHELRMREYADRVIPALRSGEITALVGAHSHYTVSLAAVFRERGLSVPGDVSIIAPHLGFEPQPGVSCIFSDRTDLIEASLDLLSSQLEGKKILCCENLIRPKLILGQTTGVSTK